jgi:replicative DNA helicase
MSDKCDIDFNKFQLGIFDEQDSERLMIGMDGYSNRIYIDESADVNVDDICKRIKILKRKYDIQTAVIDHLSLIRMDSGSNNKNSEIEKITRKLKICAKNVGIPIILLSQLNRNVEKDKKKIPHLSDLRDSGATEQDADIVMMLYREEYYKPDSAKKNIVEVYVRKNRDGMTGMVELLFIRNRMRFQEIQNHGTNSEEF